ncbi:MAG: hypothetical protein R3253_17545 [Longimicrobiales bacterium]|nr:hypothetical protein [Longimicrobiales bacterium]
MSLTQCEAVRERIPDVAAGRAAADVVAGVDAHVADCQECASELRLAAMLFESRPRIPVDLSGAVVTSRRRAGPTLRRPWWGISAAAVAALALGIGIHSSPAGDASSPGAGEAMVEADEEELWLGDDGVLAGALVFEALSDETLAALLEELSQATPGGQV